MKRNTTSLSAAISASALRAWVRCGIAALSVAAILTVGSHDWPVRAATDRFVAVGGNDMSNDCSSAGNPCATIQHAISQSASGDVIKLGPGTYFENVNVSQNVTIQGDPSSPSIVNGGGIGTVFRITAPSVTLRMLTITNGNGPGEGGGIILDTPNTLTVTQSTISGNTGGTGNSTGGGIFNGSLSTLTVINSTISGNTAGAGGGVFSFVGATATFVNTTINGNTATQGGGIFNAMARLNLTNTIIGGSLGGRDCVNHGTIATNDHNLIQDGSCSPALSGDPKLGPLQNNGGPTFTHALLSGSPAIDAGDDSVLGSPLFLTNDQRGPGFPRKGGMHVDIGAFEVQISPSDSIEQLIAAVDGFNLQPRGIGVSLDAKLNAALSALAAGDTAMACVDLSDFINEVNAQSGKKLTDTQADALRASADSIRTALGCP